MKRARRFPRLSWPLHRLAAGALALALALLTAAEHRNRLEARERLEEALAETGMSSRVPEVADRVRREADVLRAELALARALLAEAADPGWIASLESDRARRAAQGLGPHLLHARQTAATALTARPASWEASMVVGGGRYLEWLHQMDPRLFTARGAWEVPLQRAAELAPGNRDPERLLCSAYLPLWRSLRPAEQDRLLPLIRSCLGHPATFRRAAAVWLAVARDEDQALEAIPDDPEAWSGMGRLFARAGDWTRFVMAHRRAQESRYRRAIRDLGAAEARLAGGDRAGATRTFHQVVATLPPVAGSLPLAARALERCPAGTPTDGQSARIRLLFERALDLCMVQECPLPLPLLQRLGAWSGVLPTHLEALLLLAAHDLEGAERLRQRRAAHPDSEQWARYLFWRARLLLERGADGAAQELLARLPARRAGSPLATELGRRSGMTGLATGTRAWPATFWSWQDGAARLELPLHDPVAALHLEVLAVPAGGAAAQVLWNGDEVAVLAVVPGTPLELPLSAPAGLHLLEVRTLAGGLLQPGAVQVLP